VGQGLNGLDMKTPRPCPYGLPPSNRSWPSSQVPGVHRCTSTVMPLVRSSSFVSMMYAMYLGDEGRSGAGNAESAAASAIATAVARRCYCWCHCCFMSATDPAAAVAAAAVCVDSPVTAPPHPRSPPSPSHDPTHQLSRFLSFASRSYFSIVRLSTYGGGREWAQSSVRCGRGPSRC
jgi:hypothetical protein